MAETAICLVDADIARNEFDDRDVAKQQPEPLPDRHRSRGDLPMRGDPEGRGDEAGRQHETRRVVW